LQPVWTRPEAEAFAEGVYEPLLAHAEEIGLPVCLFMPGYAESLVPYLRKFPKLCFIVDHCGIGFPNIPPGRSPEEEARVLSPSYFDDVLELAEFPNVALKRSHAQKLFGAPHYPYETLRPHLRKAIEAFGVKRLMWASDKTVMFGHSWANLLYSVRDDPELSLDEKEWILGRSARAILKWPVSESAAPTLPQSVAYAKVPS
jgi:predicted TIM-barrel fold metal-dependent hydrolase